MVFVTLPECVVVREQMVLQGKNLIGSSTMFTRQVQKTLSYIFPSRTLFDYM